MGAHTCMGAVQGHADYCNMGWLDQQKQYGTLHQ